jgi:Ca2+-binding RTX toxin-like protein
MVAGAMLPAAAQASTVAVRHVSNNTGDWVEVYYVAGPGERNNLLVGWHGDDIRLIDSGADITATGQCRPVDVHSVICRGKLIPDVVHAVLGDLDDRIGPARRSGDIEVHADGGPGDDVLRGVGDEVESDLSGGDGNDQLYATNCCSTLDGGAGNDQLHGGAWPDTLAGGPGDDVLYGGPAKGFGTGDSLDGGGGRDRIYGGAGEDTITDGDRDGAAPGLGPDTDTIDGGGGFDTVSYKHRTEPVVVRIGHKGAAGEAAEHDDLSRIENAEGGAGDDRLTGDHGKNVLDGGSGDDVVRGAAGSDQLSGGRGADRMSGGRGADSIRGGPGLDVLSCGAGNDELDVDGRRAREVVPRSCEQVLFTLQGDPWLSVSSRPRRIRAGLLGLRTACPYADPDAYVGCHGTVMMRETRGRHRLLAKGRFSRKADGANFTIALAVTSTGARWASGRLGRGSATIAMRERAESTPRRPFTWRIPPP